MAVYEHIETGDRVRPSKGDRYEQLLKRSPLYRLVDPEDDSPPEPEAGTTDAALQPEEEEEPKPSRARRRTPEAKEEGEGSTA